MSFTGIGPTVTYGGPNTTAPVVDPNCEAQGLIPYGPKVGFSWKGTLQKVAQKCVTPEEAAALNAAKVAKKNKIAAYMSPTAEATRREAKRKFNANEPIRRETRRKSNATRLRALSPSTPNATDPGSPTPNATDPVSPPLSIKNRIALLGIKGGGNIMTNWQAGLAAQRRAAAMTPRQNARVPNFRSTVTTSVNSGSSVNLPPRRSVANLRKLFGAKGGSKKRSKKNRTKKNKNMSKK